MVMLTHRLGAEMLVVLHVFQTIVRSQLFARHW